MKRYAMVLAVLATWPFLFAGGGFNPPQDGFKIAGPAFNGTFVIDVTNGQSSLRLHKGQRAAALAWVMPEDTRTFLFSRGCLTGQADMDLRFKNARLTDLGIPAEDVAAVLADLGVLVSGSNTPLVSDVDTGTCSPESAGISGVLSFTGVVQFIVPTKNAQ